MKDKVEEVKVEEEVEDGQIQELSILEVGEEAVEPLLEEDHKWKEEEEVDQVEKWLNSEIDMFQH